MCQIHFIYNKEGITKQDLDEFIKLMCFGSLSNNKDAWGVFNKNTILKRSGEFDPSLIDKSLINGKFLIGHNRFSTFGVGPIIEFGKIFKRSKKESKLQKEKIEEMQHHPFKIGNFLLVHNGVITNADSLFKKYNIKTQIKTDSFAIIYLINHYFKLSLKKDIRSKVIDAIRKTSKKLEGWYSVILYDKKDNSIYYFRNDNTTFNFHKINDNLLVGSSRHINLDYTYTHDIKKHTIPKENAIYLIGETEDGLFTKVGVLSGEQSCNIKKEVMNEEPGKLYKDINSLPGNPTKYEISENFEISIICNKTQKKLLNEFFKSKKINFKSNDNKLIFKLEHIYNGN